MDHVACEGPGNFSRAANLHLTVAFLGELAEAPRVSMDVERVCLMKSERLNGKLTYTPVGENRKQEEH